LLLVFVCLRQGLIVAYIVSLYSNLLILAYIVSLYRNLLIVVYIVSYVDQVDFNSPRSTALYLPSAEIKGMPHCVPLTLANLK
jgi:cytochrome c oxidase subunit IV